MATIKLGSAPKNFKKTVTVTLPDGSQGSIECLFKYRTVKEYGQFIDALGQGAVPAGGDAAHSLEAYLGRTIEKSGEYLMQVLDGWNLDQELTPATAQQLCDEVPGASLAIIEAYRAASVEGRLGN